MPSSASKPGLRALFGPPPLSLSQTPYRGGNKSRFYVLRSFMHYFGIRPAVETSTGFSPIFNAGESGR